MSKVKKILFITEGKNDEPDVINKFMKICYSRENYNFAIIEKNIHMLIADLKDRHGHIDPNLDIQKVLQENEHDKEKIKILQDRYTDIILIFDLDPQNNITEYENIKLLLEYFNDSTDNGKLFINYPMMQSYKHLKRYETIEEFCNKKVDILDCNNYKHIVGDNSDYKYISRYNFNTILKLLTFNIIKINYLLNNKVSLLDANSFEDLKQVDIFDKEYKFISKGEVSILNTSILFVVDYKPKEMINKLKNYQ